MKRLICVLLAGILAALLLGGCEKGGSSGKTLSYDDAVTEMNTLVKSLKTTQTTRPIMDIYDDNSSAVTLSDISTFPVVVEGKGEIDIEIAAATELSSEAPDDWLNVIAERFNAEKYAVNGKTVSVSVRKITSGEVVTYINDGNYRPEVFIPSNFAWGLMLEASGIQITELTDRIAGNTAGLLIKKDTYNSLKEKYTDVNMKTVIEASLAGDVAFAYTNPYTSSTGLNILASMMIELGEGNPLSESAVSELQAYQATTPPVAYTTGVLKQSAAKGIISAMVMEEQAFINTSELRGYEYIPEGIRHDHPVYAFDWDTEEDLKAAQMFVEYCQNEESQKLANEKGFNRHDDYQYDGLNLSGSDYLNIQKVWKMNKDGGKPVIAVFVADVSGSMDGTPIRSLKDSLVNASRYIGEENYIGLISYSGNVNVNLPISQFDATQQAYFRGEVKALSASGNTATYDAVLTGLKMLVDEQKNVPDSKLMMFLLTDGEQNAGYDYSRIKGLVSGLKIPVYTIAYNYNNTTELKDLANLNEAACLSADSDDIVNQLRNLFNVEL